MAITSPCIKNCCLDENDICLGCFRSVEEIIQWGAASDEERAQILLVAEKRKAERKEKFSL